MSPETEKLLLVIPAFHESARLPPYLRKLVGVLGRARWHTVIQVVDDGSAPAEQARLVESLRVFQEEDNGKAVVSSVEFLRAHRGKGAAIRHGWEKISDETIVGFVDADGSIPAREIVRAMEWLCSKVLRPALFTSRVRMLGRTIHRRAVRHFFGRLFAHIVAQRLAISCYDSQCGLKLLPAVCFESIRRDLAEDGFCIDLDILLQLERRGCLVAEFPIDWHDHSESRVRVFRDGWRMLRALNRLRRRQRAIAEVDRRELPVFSPTAQ